MKSSKINLSIKIAIIINLRKIFYLTHFLNFIVVTTNKNKEFIHNLKGRGMCGFRSQS